MEAKTHIAVHRAAHAKSTFQQIANTTITNTKRKVHKMRIFITGLLKGRKTRWSMLAVLVATAGLSVAWLGPNHYRLGGAFIGSPAGSDGLYWSALQIPLDSAGQTAVARINTYNSSAAAAFLLAFSGADMLTEGIGQFAMINGDTAKCFLVFYGVKQGTLGVAQEVKQIWTWDGTMTFTSANSYNANGTMLVYSADTDADGDGRPDPGAQPLFDPIPSNLAVTRALP
jgi:hypothetical protein